MKYLAYSIAWMSAAIVSIAGLRFTGSGWCVLVMLIPTLVNFDSRDFGEEGENKND